MKTAQIVIASIFGRGIWLATELSRQGMSVTLLDLTEQMGVWISEDTEGPFGVFLADQFRESQLERLNEEERLAVQVNGFSIWLKNGPLELKGPLTRYRLEKLGIPFEVQNLLLEKPSLAGQARKDKNINPHEFRQNWLIALANLYGSAVFFPQVLSEKTGVNHALFSDFAMRTSTRAGHQKSLEWCSRHGVKVLQKADVSDFSFTESDHLQGVEINLESSAKSEILEFDQLTWCLTGEESGMLGTRIRQYLYPKGIIEPTWYWARYRTRMKIESAFLEGLQHCVWIDKVELPWSHENFIIMQRTANSELCDFWMLLPNVQRFNREYLQYRGAHLIKAIQAKLKRTTPQIIEYPLGFDSTYNIVGPARQPVFIPETKSQLHQIRSANLSFHSPEVWRDLSWQGRLERESALKLAIENWWKRMLAKEPKESEMSGGPE